MYYAQQVTNAGTVLNPIRTIEYWAFENKAQRDQMVMSNPMMYETFKKDVPENKTVKRFHHFKESFSGLFLIPIEG